MTDIVYLVSHGFAARMLIQTNLLGKLVREGLDVTVLTPDSEDEVLREYGAANGVSIVKYTSTTSVWSLEYFNFRRYLFEDIKNNPALYEKHLRMKYTIKEQGVFRKLRYWLYNIVYLIQTNLPFVKKLFEKLEYIFLKDATARKVLKVLEPKTVISTYPVNQMEAVVLLAANKMTGIKTIIHLLSWDNISCKGRFPQLADEYIAWGPIMAEELSFYYSVRESQISICGVPHFDLHIEVKNNPDNDSLLQGIGLDANAKYIFFAMSSPYFAPGEMDIIEWLSGQIIGNIFGDIYLIIRPHPQNVNGEMANSSWLNRLKSLQSSRVFIDWPELAISHLNWSMRKGDMKRLANLINGSLIVINSGSTVSIDALMHDKPVIITAFDADLNLPWWQSAKRLTEFRHLKKLIDTKAVNVVQSFDELQKAVLEYLQFPGRGENFRKDAIDRECDVQNGFATERVVAVIKRLTNKERA